MISRVAEIFEGNGFNPEASKFIAGVSGGLDSMTLLYIIKQLKYEVVVVHVNYKKRGVESDHDADLVARKANEYGFDFKLFDYTEPNSKSGNFQEKARDFRRQKFEEVLVETNSNNILLAHHADDQIETILQKLFKGAGISSVSGMHMVEDKYFRPLVDFSRKEIEDYARLNGIEWGEDSSNKNSFYSRNWIRNEFSKHLDHFFPGWEKNIARHAHRLDAVNELLDEWFDKNQSPKDSLVLSILEKKSDGLQSLILHHWLDKRNLHVSEGVINQILGLIKSNPGSKVLLNDRCEIQRNRESLDIIWNPITSNSHHCSINWDEIESKPFTITGFGIDLVCEIINSDPANSLNVSLPASQNSATPQPWKPNELYLDANTLKFPLVLKAWDDGDKFTPLGMSTTKLVSDLLNNRKIDPSKKRSALKLIDFDENICAIIFPHPTTKGQTGNICNDCKITEQTTSVLNIKISYNYEH